MPDAIEAKFGIPILYTSQNTLACEKAAYRHPGDRGNPISLMLTNTELLKIAARILTHYQLDPAGIHGIDHWGRVLENGILLGGMSGADIRIVQLFALFHDSRRQNDGHDPDHGARGAKLAGEMNGSLFTLNRNELSLLQDACIRHTMGFTEADITVQVCWDADRLDLPRVQKFPIPELLCTKAAHDAHFIELTSQRSIDNDLTAFALEMRNLLV